MHTNSVKEIFVFETITLIMWGSSQSLDSFSGILFPSALFKTNRYLLRADQYILFDFVYEAVASWLQKI